MGAALAMDRLGTGAKALKARVCGPRGAGGAGCATRSFLSSLRQRSLPGKVNLGSPWAVFLRWLLIHWMSKKIRDRLPAPGT